MQKINLKNTHLIVSVIILVPIAISYGISPNVPTVFTFDISSIDLKNIFRAIMGLYLAIISFWILGITKLHYWKAATLINIFFMLGLALGRLLSFIADGIPSKMWIYGTIAELLIAFWGIANLKKYSKNITA